MDDDLLGACVLGDSLGSLRDSVLGKLSWEEEPDSSLDFTRGDGGPLVVVGKTGSLSSNSLKDVIDKGVHDAHGLRGDTSVGVDLLQYLVDIDAVAFLPPALLLLVALGDGLLGLASLLGGLSRGLGWHGSESERRSRSNSSGASNFVRMKHEIYTRSAESKTSPDQPVGKGTCWDM